MASLLERLRALTAPPDDTEQQRLLAQSKQIQAEQPQAFRPPAAVPPQPIDYQPRVQALQQMAQPRTQIEQLRSLVAGERNTPATGEELKQLLILDEEEKLKQRLRQNLEGIKGQ